MVVIVCGNKNCSRQSYSNDRRRPSGFRLHVPARTAQLSRASWCRLSLDDDDDDVDDDGDDGDDDDGDDYDDGVGDNDDDDDDNDANNDAYQSSRI